MKLNNYLNLLAHIRGSKINYSLDEEDTTIFHDPVKDSVASAAVSGRKNQDNILIKGLRLSPEMPRIFPHG